MQASASKAWAEKDWRRVRIVRPVQCQCRMLTESERRAHELVSLLEAPALSASRQKRLEALMGCFSEEELVRILAAASPAEIGCIRVPRRLRFGTRTSHLQTPHEYFMGPHTGPVERLIDSLDRRTQ